MQSGESIEAGWYRAAGEIAAAARAAAADKANGNGVLARSDSGLRVRVRPMGTHVENALKRSADDQLDDLYDPEAFARSLYAPIETFKHLYYAPVRVGRETCDPPSPHRLQVIEMERRGGRLVPRMREVMVRSGKALRDLSETREYRQSRFFETTGDWQSRGVDPGAYRKFIEHDAFAMGDDLPTAGAGSSSMTSSIDTEWVPVMGGPYHRQQYLYQHWEQTAKAFEMRHHSELAKASLEIISDFTLGRGISWKISHPRVEQVWREFWLRNEMDRRLRQLNDDLTWQGELLIRKYEVLAGFVTIRSLDPSCIYEIVTEPSDIEQVYFYHAQYPCLDGDTRIACLDGTEPTVAELALRNEPTWLYSYDHESKRIVPGLATKIWEAGTKRCVRVTLDNDEQVICTYDHPFLMRDGSYVEACALQPGTSLMPLYRRQGYEHVWQPEDGWELTHHMAVGGKPDKGLAVHHVNHRRTDNRPDNLRVLSKAEHDREHGTEKRRVMAARRPDADGYRRGKTFREAASARKKAWWANPANRARMSARVRQQWQEPGMAERMKAGISKAMQAHEAMAKVGAVRNHKVVSVEPAGNRVIYDIQVDRYHNFALACGVFTHNTQYQLPYTDMRGQRIDVPLMRYVICQYPANEMYHLKHNVSSTEKWGRSDWFTSLGTLKRHRDWVNAATLKDMLQANFVWKIKITGDDADVQAFMANPTNATLPAYGGTWVENSALELTPMHEDVAGAQRAQGNTGQFLTALFATAMQMPSTYFNMAGPGVARATALSQSEPFVKRINTRQNSLRRLLDHLYEYVIQHAVRSGRLDRDDIRHEDADPEWIFPTTYEEDRGAKFRDLMAAKAQGAISHRTQSTQMGMELNLPEYDYDDELRQIESEMAQPLGKTLLWPAAQGGMGGLGPPPPPAAGNTPPGSAPGGGGLAQMLQRLMPPGTPNMGSFGGEHEKVAGADDRAEFRRTQTGRPPTQITAPKAPGLSKLDKKVMREAMARGLRGQLRLPSGVLVSLLEAYDEEQHPRDEHGRWTDAGGGNGDGDGSAAHRFAAQVRHTLTAGAKDDAARMRQARGLDALPDGYVIHAKDGRIFTHAMSGGAAFWTSDDDKDTLTSSELVRELGQQALAHIGKESRLYDPEEAEAKWRTADFATGLQYLGTPITHTSQDFGAKGRGTRVKIAGKTYPVDSIRDFGTEGVEITPGVRITRVVTAGDIAIIDWSDGHWRAVVADDMGSGKLRWATLRDSMYGVLASGSAETHPLGGRPSPPRRTPPAPPLVDPTRAPGPLSLWSSNLESKK